MVRFFVISIGVYWLLGHSPWVDAATLAPPDAREVVRYWQQTLDALDPFEPQFAASKTDGRLWFRGWRDSEYEAAWWPGERGYTVLVNADLPNGWGAPDDGQEWISVRPPVWTVAGLPDRDGYCLRAQMLALAQAARVARRMSRDDRPLLLLAEGLGAPAALALAAAQPDATAGVVLLDPAPYQHLVGNSVGVPDAEGVALARLLAANPTWRGPLGHSLAVYDLAALAPVVSCPVVVVVSDRCPQWLGEAVDDWQWQALTVGVPRPRLAALAQAPWFGTLWADCLEAVSRRGSAGSRYSEVPALAP